MVTLKRPFGGLRLFGGPSQEAMPLEPEVEVKPAVLAPADNRIAGINVVRVVQDHGLGQLSEIDEEIKRHEEKLIDLRLRRETVVSLLRVLDPSVQ